MSMPSVEENCTVGAGVRNCTTGKHEVIEKGASKTGLSVLMTTVRFGTE